MAHMARCTGHQHVRGAWVEASEAAVAYGPPCCSKDGDNFMTRPNSCGTQRTVHSPYMDTGLTVRAKRTWPLAHMGGNACSCLGHVDRLVWRPSHCSIAPFDGERFCAALGRRRLLFIGDSTMQQIASTVMSWAQWSFWPQAANGCADQLAYAPSDTLIHRPLGRLNRGQGLAGALRGFKPDVLVAASGAHIYGEENYQTMLRGVAEILAQLRSPPKLIWATTTGAGCGAEPLADSSPWSLQALWRDLDARSVRTHNWANFSVFDILARHFWSAKDGHANGTCVLDLKPLHQRVDARIESPRRAAYADPGGPKSPHMTAAGEWRKAKRSDGYRDCLHFCAPGPLNLAPALLQQVLEECARG